MYDTRFENYTLPSRNTVRAFAITTSQTNYDLEAELGEKAISGYMVSLVSDVDVYVQTSTGEEDAIDSTVVSEDGSGDSAEDTAEQCAPIFAESERRFVVPANEKYLHVRGSAEGTLWLWISSTLTA